MRGDIKLIVRDKKSEKELILTPAAKGYNILIDGQMRFFGISFSLPEVNDRFTAWKRSGTLVFTKKAIPKSLSEVTRLK
jgi:hypothetical protein